eukprot:3495582-Ditylum_brightwellii.AAC.2
MEGEDVLSEEEMEDGKTKTIGDMDAGVTPKEFLMNSKLHDLEDEKCQRREEENLNQQKGK